MRRMSGIFPVVASLLFLASCGGSGSGNITGPILDVSQLQSIVIDQLAISGGLEDEYRGEGEYAIYLRDAATGKDMACAGALEGMNHVAGSGVYQGGLNIRLREVNGDHPSSAARFKLVFVEKDAADCPAAIDNVDDIVGESPEMTSEELLGRSIWTTNALAVTVLRQESTPVLTVSQMAASLTDGLAIDQLSFIYNADNDNPSRFYLYAQRYEGDEPIAQCQIDDALMQPIQYGGMFYAALGFPFACLNPADPQFPEWKVRVGIYVQRDSGPELLGQTEVRAIGDMIGEKLAFEGVDGFVSFRRVVTKPFATTMVRLADLTSLTIGSITHSATLPADAVLELHAMDPESGLSLACTGSAQGLTNVNAAGLHEGLTASMVSMTPLHETFGTSTVVMVLVKRNDGKACPAMPESSLTTIAATQPLESAGFASSPISFSDGTGSFAFSVSN